MTDDELRKASAWLKNAESYDNPKPRISVNHVILLRSMVAEIERLRAELSAAIGLLSAPTRITWGYHLDKQRMLYYLDGRHAGNSLDDVVRMAAEAAGKGGEG